MISKIWGRAGRTVTLITRTRRRLLRAARALKKESAVPPRRRRPQPVYTNVQERRLPRRRHDRLAPTPTILQMRTALRPLQQAAE